VEQGNKKTAYQKPISSLPVFSKLVNPAGSSARKKLFQGGARRR